MKTYLGFTLIILWGYRPEILTNAASALWFWAAEPTCQQVLEEPDLMSSDGKLRWQTDRNQECRMKHWEYIPIRGFSAVLLFITKDYKTYSRMMQQFPTLYMDRRNWIRDVKQSYGCCKYKITLSLNFRNLMFCICLIVWAVKVVDVL